MNTSDLLTYRMSKLDADQSVHSDWKTTTQIKSGGELFAIVHEVKGRPAVSLKPRLRLRSCCVREHSDVFLSEHLNKTHWRSTLLLDNSLKDSQIYYLVDVSYQKAGA